MQASPMQASPMHADMSSAEMSPAEMAHLNIAKLRAARIETEPYAYTIVPGFLSSESVALIKHFFDGQFGDPVEIAMSKAELRAGRDTPKFQTILEAVRELIAEERFLHWQVAFPGVWTDWEAEGLPGDPVLECCSFEPRCQCTLGPAGDDPNED